jgi:excisionase family DNA binding protein
MTPGIHEIEHLNTVAETKSRLRIGHTKFYDLLKKGELETVTIGRRRLVRESSIRKILHQGAS